MLKHKQLKNKQQSIGWRRALVSGLVILLIIVGHQEDYIKNEVFMLLRKVHHLYLGNNFGEALILDFEKFANRMLNLGYRLLYCSICLFIIHAYFCKLMITKLASLLYLFLFGLTISLYVAAEQLQSSQLKIVAFRVDTLLVSPMLIVILIPAIYFQIDLKVR